MFTITEIRTGTHLLQVREELLTGHRCKISPGRLNRGIDTPYRPAGTPGNCPFCSEQIFSVTPVFPDGNRICKGESVTFPNLFPFAEWHTVTAITRRHQVTIIQQAGDRGCIIRTGRIPVEGTGIQEHQLEQPALCRGKHNPSSSAGACRQESTYYR